MPRKGFFEELNHLKILKRCEDVIERYMTSPKPHRGLSQKVGHAIELYKRSIPTTNNDILSGKLKVSWDDFIGEVEKRIDIPNANNEKG